MAALAGQGQRTSRHCTGRTVRDKQTKQGWVGGTTHERRRQPPQVAHDARPCRRRLQTSIPYLYSLVASSHSLSMTPHVRTPPPPGLCARDQPLSRLRVALSPRVWTGAPMYGNEPSHAGWTDAAGNAMAWLHSQARATAPPDARARSAPRQRVLRRLKPKTQIVLAARPRPPRHPRQSRSCPRAGRARASGSATPPVGPPAPPSGR